MLLSVSPDAARVQPPALPPQRALPAQRSASISTESPSEDSLELLYRHYLAQRALQDLFEAGALQALES